MSKFHYLVRAVVIQDTSILLVRAKGAANTFLPGGHIEFAETAHSALKREIFEEIGCDATVGEFLGAVEHVWPARSKDNHEINLVFSASISNCRAGTDPVSKEAHLSLFWVNLAELDKFNLQPGPLVELIHRRSNWASFEPHR